MFVARSLELKKKPGLKYFYFDEFPYEFSVGGIVDTEAHSYFTKFDSF